MLRLVSAEPGQFGIIRRYTHSRFGHIKTLTTWRQPGAEILRVYREASVYRPRSRENEVARTWTYFNGSLKDARHCRPNAGSGNPPPAEPS
jgi:hypothetical protein